MPLTFPLLKTAQISYALTWLVQALLEVAEKTQHTRNEIGPEPEMPEQGRSDIVNRFDPHVLYGMDVLQADVLETLPTFPGMSTGWLCWAGSLCYDRPRLPSWDPVQVFTLVVIWAAALALTLAEPR